MVIIRTSAVEVSIHAVSPALILSAPTSSGAVGAAAAGAVCPAATPSHNPAATTSTRRRTLLLKTVSSRVSQRGRILLAGAYPHDLGELSHEDLAVAHFAGARGLHDGVDHLLGEGVGNRDLDAGLGYELDGVLRAPVHLGVAALPAETAHLADREAPHPDIAQNVAHLIQAVRLDDGGDQFHRVLLLPCPRPLRAPRRPPRAAKQAACLPVLSLN